MATGIDADLDRRRRDIYAVSLGLLVFNLAGGSLDSMAPTFFGTIHITRPIFLTIGIWFAWAYFLWRFWLAGTPIWASFQDDVDAEIELSAIYGRFMQHHFRAALEILRGEAPDNSGWIATLENGQKDGFAKHFSELARDGARYRVAKRTCATTFQRGEIVLPDGRAWGGAMQLPDAPFNSLLERHPWEGHWRTASLVIGALSAASKRHAFSDRVLPVIAAVAALVAFLARQAWHVWLSYSV